MFHALALHTSDGRLDLNLREGTKLTEASTIQASDGSVTLRVPQNFVVHMFARVACAYADDVAHAQRLYDAMSRLWFMPATPILSNGGTTRGLPISCFLNAVSDSLESIVATWNENVWLAANGGGIGTYWGQVRSIGEPVKGAGETSGIIPFIHVMDGLTLAISQALIVRVAEETYALPLATVEGGPTTSNPSAPVHGARTTTASSTATCA